MIHKTKHGMSASILIVALAMSGISCGGSGASMPGDDLPLSFESGEGGRASLYITYKDDIYPLFTQSCSTCHNTVGSAANLLDYSVVIAKRDQLLERIAGRRDPHLEPLLKEAERELVMTWLLAGAPYDELSTENGALSPAPAPALPGAPIMAASPSPPPRGNGRDSANGPGSAGPDDASDEGDEDEMEGRRNPIRDKEPRPLPSRGSGQVPGYGSGHDDDQDRERRQGDDHSVPRPPYTGPISFRSHIEGIFKKSCASCHGTTGTLPNLLDYNMVLANQLKLLDRVVIRKDMPPVEAATGIAALTSGDRETLAAWIRVGAPYDYVIVPGPSPSPSAAPAPAPSVVPSASPSG